ncbi:Minor tail protein Z (GPZ) of prophage [Escherichia coli]|nr:Minor tail protein Z (GPZ) of prophage [Escherichia coli]
MKGLENAIRNLNSLDTRMVPQASAWAVKPCGGKDYFCRHTAGCAEYRCRG